jgi:hypothetical protein
LFTVSSRCALSSFSARSSPFPPSSQFSDRPGSSVGGLGPQAWSPSVQADQVDGRAASIRHGNGGVISGTCIAVLAVLVSITVLVKCWKRRGARNSDLPGWENIDTAHSTLHDPLEMSVNPREHTLMEGLLGPERNNSGDELDELI